MTSSIPFMVSGIGNNCQHNRLSASSTVFRCDVYLAKTPSGLTLLCFLQYRAGMLCLLKLIFGVLFCSFRSRRDLLLENLALRQQLCALARRRPQPRFSNGDRLLWVMLRRLWPGWRRAVILVQPETVVRWHRAGFKLYWKWISRPTVCVGRRPTSKEVRELIFRMMTENPTWGSTANSWRIEDARL